MDVPPLSFPFLTECLLFQKLTPFLVPLIECGSECCASGLRERQYDRTEFLPCFQFWMLRQFLRDGL